MQILRKHLHLSVVLFDQLRCYLTHRIGVVRSPPARFRPECTIAVITQVIGGINHFSQMPHLDALHIHFQEVIRDFIDKARLLTLNGTEDGNKVITIVHWIKEAALSGEQSALIVGFNIRLRIAIQR